MNPPGIPVYPGGLPVAYQGDPAAAAVQQQVAQAAAAAYQGQAGVFPGMFGAPNAAMAHQQAQQAASQPSQQPVPAVPQNVGQTGTPGAAPAAPPGGQNLKFESALGFLDKVKTVFADQQDVYNKFLDIMKGFKTQTIDTPGVIQRVKTLFKGHPDLISGFNNFLPPGYKIEPEDLEDDKEETKARATPAAKQRMMPAQAGAPMGVGFGGADAQAQGAAGDDLTRKQPELDHARTYVKKIKMRFGSQPQIYKQFLEILHTFHREQHTIQDVYQQVAKLFKDHADLLSEFAQFLPDPSIHGPGGPPSMLGQQQHHKDDDSGRSVQTRGRGAARPALEPSGRATSRQAASAAAAAAAASQPPRVTVARNNARDNNDDRKDGSWGSFDELSYFFRIKMALTGTTSTSATSEAYDEFLKVLSLFNQEIITRQELYILVKELLRGHDGELTVWFRNFLNVDDEDGDEPMGMSEVDWGSANKLGPSYREMPDKLRQQAKCTGRQDNPICAEVLNDQWVSVPTGSEDGTGFKSSRKNQYEELLFKCEDDRFELDLVIENNLSTIRQLDSLAEQFKGVKATGATDNELKLRDEDLDALAVRSIKRVYGDRGEEVLKLLFTRPVHAIPVVLNRLKQKHIEWSQTRRDWNKLWRQISKKHYSKALDYQSVNFKAEEKKNLSAKNLLAELKRKAGPALPLAVTAANIFESEALGGPHAELQYASSDFVAQHQYLVRTVLPSAIGAESPSTPNALTPTEQSNAAAVGYVMGLTDADVELGTKAFSTGFSSLWGDARRLVSCLFENVHPKIDKPKFENVFDDFLGALFKYVPSSGFSGASAAGVKPVATQVDAANAFSSSKSVALGSEQFYLVCKYLHVLLQRLAQARELAARPPPLKTKPQPEMEAQAQFEAIKKAKEAAATGNLEPKKDPDAMDTTPADGATSSTAPAATGSDAMDVDTTDSMEMASAMPKSAPLTVEAIRARYDGFLTCVQNLISNAIDQSALEEEIRDSLGVDSFPLFTTERVVQLVGKNLVQILTDDSLMQVVNIFTYELSRGAAAFADGAYINNIRQVLGQERKAYRLLFHSDKNLLHVHEVALFPGQGGAAQAGNNPDGTNSNGNVSGNSITGPFGSQQQGGSSSSGDASSANGPSGGANGSQPMQTDAAESLQLFINGESDHTSTHSPFLKRNVSSMQSHVQERNIFVQNDLAVFVDPIASRLRYLRDSEDVLVRRGRTATSAPNRSSSRLAAKFPNQLTQQPVFAGAQ